MSDVSVEVRDDHVAVVEFSRPPHNYFDADLIGGIADAYDQVDEDPRARAIVLCSAGKHFCAGADFGGDVVVRRRVGRHGFIVGHAR